MAPYAGANLGSLLAGAFLVVLVGLASSGRCDTEARGADELDLIARNVAANEQLFGNLELLMETTLRYIGPKDAPIYLATELGILLYEREDARCVYQGDLFYFKSSSAGRTTTEGEFNEEYTYAHAYDGELTRLAGRTVANIRHERYEGKRLVRPHTLLLMRFGGGAMRLSQFLIADSFPGSDHLRVTYEGEEEIDGLHCLRLRCDFWDDGQEDPDFRLIWLAPQRNYLPVKLLGYGTNYSSDIPLEEAQVTNLRELAPGVWFPFEARFVVNAEWEAPRGKRVPTNEELYAITKADLNPQYDKSFFQQVEIPDGAVVREYRDGQLIRSYVQGESETPEQGQIPKRRTVATLSVVGLSIVAALFALARHRRRQG